VPFVKEGSKTQTIRSFRNSIPREGQTAFLYYGMRTRWCKKLGEGTIYNVFCIFINKKQEVVIIGTNFVSNEQIKLLKKGNYKKLDVLYKVLTDEEKDDLAYRDGFRKEHSDERKGCFEIMITWWKQTHELPFIGHLICWNLTDKK